MIEWNDSHSTGISAIDSQHRVLYKYVNYLETLLKTPDRRPIHAENAIFFIESYAKSHFNFEEGCMEEWHCPAAAQNKKAHEEFLKMVLVYKDRMKQDTGDVDVILKEIHRAIVDWIMYHIANVDCQLRGCVRTAGTAARVAAGKVAG